MENHFDGAALSYQAMMLQPWHQLRISSAFANLEKQLVLNGHWIDVGAGTGEFSWLLTGSGVRVSAFDQSSSMREILELQSRNNHLLEALKCADISEVHGEFDGAVLHNVLEYIPNRLDFLRLLSDKIRSRGWISILCANPVAAVYTNAVRGAKPKEILALLEQNRQVVGMPSERFEVEAYAVQSCMSDLKQIGLRVVAHRGVRLISDLAPGHNSQNSEEWLVDMLRLEQEMGGSEPFRSVARHWQLIVETS